jgi:tetratricopeptide (TPR) repeat protein
MERMPFRHLLMAVALLLLLAAALAGIARQARRDQAELPLAFLTPAPAKLSAFGFAGALAGMRRVAADWAYIEMLQYYGTGRNRLDNSFQGVIPLADEIFWLDPHFRFGILYTAAIMGFNEGHLAEAISLLQRAARTDPSYPRYRLYLAGLTYRKAHDDPRALQILELMVEEPDRPEILVRTLGNLYIKNKQWPKVRAYWMRVVMTDKDPRTLWEARLALAQAAQHGN